MIMFTITITAPGKPEPVRPDSRWLNHPGVSDQRFAVSLANIFGVGMCSALTPVNCVDSIDGHKVDFSGAAGSENRKNERKEAPIYRLECGYDFCICLNRSKNDKETLWEQV